MRALRSRPVRDWPVPPIVTRAQWGANEALRRTGQIYDAPVAKIIVHHTVRRTTSPTTPGLCRSILANETSGEYIDIAYNWLIDPTGRIYEGRWAQNYPAGAAHTGERSGRERARRARDLQQLAHHRNRVDGHVRQHQPVVRDAQLACRATRVEVRTLGYRSDSGAARIPRRTVSCENIFNICGHRDTSATDCPGSAGRADAARASGPAVTARLTGAGYWIAVESRPGDCRSAARRASRSPASASRA